MMRVTGSLHLQESREYANKTGHIGFPFPDTRGTEGEGSLLPDGVAAVEPHGVFPWACLCLQEERRAPYFGHKVRQIQIPRANSRWRRRKAGRETRRTLDWRGSLGLCSILYGSVNTCVPAYCTVHTLRPRMLASGSLSVRYLEL